MHSVLIKLDSIEKVRNFVRIITDFEGDFDMCSGRYTVDAKSILGIFSLDLARPIELQFSEDVDKAAVLEAVRPFLMEE